METKNWRERAASQFDCDKNPVRSRDGMVVTNHPLASAAGMEMLAAGGNAIDAAVAALFALSVVEPMMVGILGGGMAHMRLADGRHTILDGLSTAPLASRADVFRPVSDRMPDYMEVAGRENAIGPKAMAAPGNLLGWCQTLARYGTLSLDDVLQPALRHAARGFIVTPYLSECIAEAAADLARDPEIARRFLKDGRALPAGSRLVQADYAETLRQIAAEGPDTLHGGALGRELVQYMARRDGLLVMDDLVSYRTIDRLPVRGSYRGLEIVGPPPPSSGGVHVIQMLNILEGYELKAMGFGSADVLHLIAESLKIAFADRKSATADPAFVQVPVERLIDKGYAAGRRARIQLRHAQDWDAGVVPGDSPNTTHLTVADRSGNIVTSTQTINSLFGARIMVPGTGLIPNNYMYLFDPHPGNTLSIAPGKRITTSQSPIIVLDGGRPVCALGLPGGLRIFGSVLQTLVNLIDHGMTLQEAVEAPRLWTQGQQVEIEAGFSGAARTELERRGHRLQIMAHVAGGMNAIAFDADGWMTGAACWRADGTPMGMGGGHARGNVRFWPDQAPADVVRATGQK
ncbi:MAG: gamma-glutamyltransferase [Alphaproteobacteria bacterium]|nr:gamma-glutamyltransferase [Alphaproteobacteria bacterium]